MTVLLIIAPIAAAMWVFGYFLAIKALLEIMKEKGINVTKQELHEAMEKVKKSIWKGRNIMNTESANKSYIKKIETKPSDDNEAYELYINDRFVCFISHIQVEKDVLIGLTKVVITYVDDELHIIKNKN